MERINNEIARIAKLLLEINEKGQYTTFLNLSGHVDLIEIRIYKGGWELEKEPLVFSTYYNKHYVNMEEAEEALDKLREVTWLLEDLDLYEDKAFEDRPGLFKKMEL